jgi:acetyl-CoA synthetase
MQDYQDACRDFSVAELERETLHGSLTNGLNAAIECCDRWADDGRVALHWISKDFAEKTVTFRSLSDQSAQFVRPRRAKEFMPG